jgi:hypothetical protein
LYDFWESRYRNEISDLLRGLLAADAAGEPTRQKAMALCGGGFILWSLHDFDEARRYLEESIAIAERVDDQLTIAWGLSHLGWNADFVGEYEAAESFGRRALAIARTLGDEAKTIVGQSMSFLGDIPYWRGDMLEARRLYEEAASFLREIHEVNRLTYPVRRLGYVSLQEGKIAAAMELFAESWDLNHQVGHLQGMVACTAGLAAAHLAAGNVETAAILYGWVQSQLERIGTPFFFIDTVEYERGIARLREAADPRLLDSAQNNGRGMTLEEAIRLGLEA